MFYNALKLEVQIWTNCCKYWIQNG